MVRRIDDKRKALVDSSSDDDWRQLEAPRSEEEEQSNVGCSSVVQRRPASFTEATP